jgi:hypothetical protein
VTSPNGKAGHVGAGEAAGRGKRRYEKPRLTDYGHVSKLTLTGGITTRDTGNMQRQCL